VGEQGAEGGFCGGAVVAGVEDEGGVVAELGEGLAAGAAGHGGGVVEIGDGDGAEADLRAVVGDGAGDGCLLGAAGEAEGGVFDVAAGDGCAVGEEERGADAEVRVGRVGVCGDGGGEVAEVLLFGGGEVGLGRLRHGQWLRAARTKT
jgi:hypothetical protein